MTQLFLNHLLNHQRRQLKNKQIRIAKLISHFGFCSRRNTEKLILNGDVKINNKVFKEFYICRDLINTIKVKNKALTKRKQKYGYSINQLVMCVQIMNNLDKRVFLDWFLVIFQEL